MLKFMPHEFLPLIKDPISFIAKAEQQAAFTAAIAAYFDSTEYVFNRKRILFAAVMSHTAPGVKHVLTKEQLNDTCLSLS